MFLIHRLGVVPIDDALNVSELLDTTAIDDTAKAEAFGKLLVHVAKKVGEDKICLSFKGIESVTLDALIAMGAPAVPMFLMLDVAGVTDPAVNAMVHQAAANLLTLYEASQAVDAVP